MTETTRRRPRTAKSEQTRELVLAAAREVFWRQGYTPTRVADIVKEAGVAHGTFYVHFKSKEEVLWAIAADLDQATLRTATGTRTEAEGDEVRAIELANRRFLQFYIDNRKALRVIHEVATFHPRMRKARFGTGSRFARRVKRSITRLQEAGLCDATLDAGTATTALVAMVSNFAYVTILADAPFDLDVAVDTLTKIWARGIGLEFPSTSD